MRGKLIELLKAKCARFSFGGALANGKEAFSRVRRFLLNKIKMRGVRAFEKDESSAGEPRFAASGLKFSNVKSFFSKFPLLKFVNMRFLSPKFMNLRTKELLRVYGIFTAMMIIMLTAAGGAVKLSSLRWENALRAAVEKTLSENTGFDGKVGAFVRIKSPFSLSAALYELDPPFPDGAQYALILRVQTMYGPVPAVFTYGSDTGALFVGFASVSGRVKRLLEDNDADPRLRYWTAKVPAILRAVVTGDE
ncbi:MAG: hypothetical protein ACTTKL_02245 [Treponema sp.]